MMTSLFRLSTRVLSLSAACWLGLQGCQSPAGVFSPPPPPPPSSSPSPSKLALGYLERLQTGAAAVDRLSTSSGAGPLRIDEALQRRFREALDRFRDELTRHAGLLDELEPASKGWRAADLRAALDRCGGQAQEVRNHAQALRLAFDAIETHVNALPPPNGAAGPKLGPDPTLELVAVAGKLAELAAGVDEFLADAHRTRMTPGGRDRSPAAGVFHFARLCQLNNVDVKPHATLYDISWKEWVDREVKQERFTEALDVMAMAITLTPEFRPRSLEKVYEITNAAIDSRIEEELVVRMEVLLDGIEAAYASSGGDEARRKVVDRARAALIYCRARSVSDPRRSALLASQAFRKNPLLADKAAALLLVKAREIGDALAGEGQYSEAVDTLRSIIELGPVDAVEERVARYRQEVFHRALADVRREVEQGRFPAARVLLARIPRVVGPGPEKAQLDQALHFYYESFLDQVLDRDPAQAVSVAGEALGLFPRDQRYLTRRDRGLYSLLRARIGEVESCFERLGPERIVEAVRNAVHEMRTEEGSAACEKVLAKVQQVWGRQLKECRDPARAFALATGIARLDYQSAQDSKREGAAALQAMFISAFNAGDWDLVERAIDACFALCPDFERPNGFKEAYLKLLHRLNVSGHVKRLGRHLAIFCAAYPNAAPAVRPLVVKHLDAGTAEGRAFAALLRRIDPEARELAALDAADGQPLIGEGEDLAELIDPKEIEGSDAWWQEPAGGDASLASESPPPAPRGKRVWRPISIVVCALGVLGTLATAAALVIAGSRRGPLPFSWYVAGALWLGITVGFFIGGRSTARPQSAQRGSDAINANNRR
jgi:tetratricopeptide (TPR) repeat protein